MGLSLIWPAGHLAFKHWPREAPAPQIPEPSIVAVLDPLTVQVTQESFLRSLDQPILLVWALSSGLLLLAFAGLVLRTRKMRRSWEGEETAGQPVLFSRDLGPAVVGYIRQEIVLPEWCRELEESTLELILDHELEHLRAGDLRLILTCGVVPLLFPWHLPLWWQFKRLRMAVEGDCDLRVVRKHPEQTRPYLELLLRVGGTSQAPQALMAMLSELEETLERRIKIMTMPFPKKPLLRGLLLTAVGGTLLAVACWAPSPDEVTDAESEAVRVPPEVEIPGIQAREAVELSPEIEIPPTPEELAAGVRTGSEFEGDLSANPTFTPYTVRPDIKNRSEIARALEEAYPTGLKERGIGGTVQVWFFIEETGRVGKVQVNQTSGHQALDEAALEVARAIEFTPAMNRDKAVPVWISLPITFTTSPPPPATEPSSEVPAGDISKAPTFTPYTVRPDITNRAEVARALEQEYPPLLKDAGIGGTAQVWLFIDAEGVVQNAQINQSSGHQALDEAALRVAEQIAFTSALKDDKAVPVWISLPITFTVR
jgi:TonB family protein